MNRLLALFVTAWLCTASVFAAEESSLTQARRAQALLGPEVWSEVIYVENSSGTGRYPRALHALVFELAGVLWFYTDYNGTQSFSLHRGRLEAEKADFGPLLRDIDPGFKRWAVVPADPAARPDVSRALRNGCFVESVANLRRRLMSGEPMRHPQLLSLYGRLNRRGTGHTVLTYETAAGVQVIDPADPAHPQELSSDFAANALEIGRAVFGRLVDRAVWVPVTELAAGLAGRYAATTTGLGKVLN